MSTLFRTDSTDSTTKKGNRALYVLTFIEFTFVSICLLLLLLNQYLNVVVDDYSPAFFKSDDDDDDDGPDRTSTAPVTTTHETTTHETTTDKTTTHETTTDKTTTHETTTDKTTTHETTTQETTTHEKTTTNETTTQKTTTQKTAKTANSTFKRDTGRKGWVEYFNSFSIFNDNKNKNDSIYKIQNNNDYKWYPVKESESNDWKTKIFRAYHKPMTESTTESPIYHSKTEINLNAKQEETWTDFFSSPGRVKRSGAAFLDDGEKLKTESKLSNMLIMYPCCVTVIIILLMQLVSRFSEDPMYRSTMLILICISIGVGTTIFACSLIESITHDNVITTLIAVSSAIFIILEIVELILLFVSL